MATEGHHNGTTDEADNLVKRFTSALSGRASVELQGVLHQLLAASTVGVDPVEQTAPPSRRRPRRPDVVTYRVRIDLKQTRPPLWRRLPDIQPSAPLMQQLHETPPQTTGQQVAAVRRDHRAKESGPRAHGNHRQFLSVVPNTILTHELRASQYDRRLGRTRTPFPASTAAQHSGPGS